MRNLKESTIEEFFNYIKSFGEAINTISLYIGIDVGKHILDIGMTISDSDFQTYLGTIDNNIYGFKQIESIILESIILGIDENKIFLGIENTGIYGNDVLNFFDNRIPNTYMLNSRLTCNARKFFAKSDIKSDSVDAIIIAMTLRDLDNKHKLETIDNPYKKEIGVGFIRKSISGEKNSLRILFRELSSLRRQKSSIMTSVNLYKEHLFPEINGLFSIKHRSSSEMLLINNFSRSDILNMTKKEFVKKYKSISSKGQHNSRVLSKIEDFYDRVVERGNKNFNSRIDLLTGKDADSCLLDEIKFGLKHYELIDNEMKSCYKKISDLLLSLKGYGYYIPSFIGINDIEIGLILGEIGSDIYNMTSKEFIGFVGRYPENHTSGGGHIVKLPKLSNKRGIIKEFIYVWMYGFQLHNPSFRLYKKLLMLLYGLENGDASVSNIKHKRKSEVKCGEKLLKIIHDGYKNKRSFSEEIFIKTTILPLVTKIQSLGLNPNTIKDVVVSIYKNNKAPIKIIDNQLCKIKSSGIG